MRIIKHLINKIKKSSYIDKNLERDLRNWAITEYKQDAEYAYNKAIKQIMLNKTEMI